MTIVKKIEKSYRYPKDIENLINYIYNDEETKADKGLLRYYIGLSPETNNVQSPGRNQFTRMLFERNHDIWNVPEKENLVHHVVISFDAAELTDPYEAWKIGLWVSQWYFSRGYINCFGVHTSTDNLHIHFLIDNFSYQSGNQFFYPSECNYLKNLIDTQLRVRQLNPQFSAS